MKFTLALASAITFALNANIVNADTPFPGVGHTYLVDFKQFVVELNFESKTQLTYTGIRHDGTRGDSATVSIKVTALRPKQFLVTWIEKDKTTVVHIEDYKRMVIYTNITNPDNFFEKFKGSIKLLK